MDSYFISADIFSVDGSYNKYQYFTAEFELGTPVKQVFIHIMDEIKESHPEGMNIKVIAFNRV